MLEQILTIKRHRESGAEREVNRARQAQAGATQKLDSEKAALRTLQREHDRREKALYADLCARIVKLADIQNVCSAVGQMHDEQTHQDDVIHDCTEQLARCDARLAATRVQLQIATRKVEKYVQLLAALGEETLAASERSEETELEESASVIAGRRTDDSLAEY